MSEYYGNNDWRDYLALKHHGILGQKWGKQNGPPYPLGYGEHSSAEKKANPKGRLDNYEPSSIGRKRRYITKESKRIEKRYAKDIKRLERISNRASKRYERSAENGPSRRTDRLEERYRDALTDTEALKRMRDTELERLNNMTDREIKEAKKNAREKLDELEYDSDSFFGRLKERREYKKELADERGRERLTSGERNQIKEQVGKEVASKTVKDTKESEESLKRQLRELDQQYYNHHRAAGDANNRADSKFHYEERERIGKEIEKLRDSYVANAKDKDAAAKAFDRMNDEVMSQRKPWKNQARKLKPWDGD